MRRPVVSLADYSECIHTAQPAHMLVQTRERWVHRSLGLPTTFLEPNYLKTGSLDGGS